MVQDSIGLYQRHRLYLAHVQELLSDVSSHHRQSERALYVSLESKTGTGKAHKIEKKYVLLLNSLRCAM